MRSYSNPYLGISIKFPEEWKFRFWGNRKKEPSNSVRFQSSYKDLPSKNENEKELFFAMRSVKGSPEIMSSFFSVTAIYRDNGIDFNLEPPKCETEKKREITDQIFNHREAQSVYIEQTFDSYTKRIKAISWNYSEAIWLLGIATGDTYQNFVNAVSVLNSMEFTDKF